MGTFLSIAAGASWSLAIRSDHTLAAWGRNNQGQLNVPSGTFTAIAAGKSFGVGLRTDETLAPWGSSSSGELNVPGGTFSFVDAGDLHRVAMVPAPSSLLALGCGALLMRGRRRCAVA